MTVVVSSNPGADNINAQKTAKIDGLFAAEDLPALGACRITASGVVNSLGAAANLAAAVHGVPLREVKAGEPVTLYGPGTLFQWTDAGSLTPGAAYYLAAAGGVDTATQLGDSTGIFFAASNTDLYLVKLQTVGA